MRDIKLILSGGEDAVDQALELIGEQIMADDLEGMVICTLSKPGTTPPDQRVRIASLGLTADQCINVLINALEGVSGARVEIDEKRGKVTLS